MSSERSIPQAIHVVATSHGTDNPEGQRLINQLRAQLAELAELAGTTGVPLRWHEAYVDVQRPSLTEVIDALPAGEPAVVLPLLVADGVHTTVDIAGAVAARSNTVAAAPLGPLPQLAQLLAERARPLLDGHPAGGRPAADRRARRTA